MGRFVQLYSSMLGLQSLPALHVCLTALILPVPGEQLVDYGAKLESGYSCSHLFALPPQTERLEEGTACPSLYIPRKFCYINLHNFHYSVTLQSSLFVKWRISVLAIRCEGVFSFYESVKIEVFYFLRLVGVWGILPSLPFSFLQKNRCIHPCPLGYWVNSSLGYLPGTALW